MKKIAIKSMALVELQDRFKRSNTDLKNQSVYNTDILFRHSTHLFLEEVYGCKIEKYYLSGNQTQINIYFAP